jgi:hypothetical protein
MNGIVVKQILDFGDPLSLIINETLMNLVPNVGLMNLLIGTQLKLG